MNIKFPQDYIAWDLETTGLDKTTCHILEIGAIIVRGGQIVDKKHWVLQNNVEIPELIRNLTGITPEIVAAEGRDPKECLREFWDVIKMENANLTHNGIRFDIPWLAEHITRALGFSIDQHETIMKRLRGTSVDTAVMYKAKKIGANRMWNESFTQWADRVMEVRAAGVKYNVGICCEELGIDKEGVAMHRALGDVTLTHQIYQKLTTPNV